MSCLWMAQQNENGKDTQLTVNWKTKAGVSRSGLNAYLNVTPHFVCLYFLTLEHSEGWEAVRGALCSPPVTLLVSGCKRLAEFCTIIASALTLPGVNRCFSWDTHAFFFCLNNWLMFIHRHQSKRIWKLISQNTLLALTLMLRIERKELFIVVFLNLQIFSLAH